MSHSYILHAKQGREGRKELCASAEQALVRADELRKCSWSNIAFVNDQGDEVPSSAVRQNATDDQAQAALRMVFKE